MNLVSFMFMHFEIIYRKMHPSGMGMIRIKVNYDKDDIGKIIC